MPMVSVFSLPFMRYFRRKILPSAGVTSRYRPPPSNSLAFFPASVGLAFLIWRSFRGIFGVCFRGYFQMPPNIPPVFALLNCTAMGGIRQLGRGKQDGNRPESPVVIGFCLWHWTALDKKITARKRLIFTVWCGRRDSNSHTSRRQNLNLVRLPISPRPLCKRRRDYTKNEPICKSDCIRLPFGLKICRNGLYCRLVFSAV